MAWHLVKQSVAEWTTSVLVLCVGAIMLWMTYLHDVKLKT
jgi:hypothetical protein